VVYGLPTDSLNFFNTILKEVSYSTPMPTSHLSLQQCRFIAIFFSLRMKAMEMTHSNTSTFLHPCIRTLFLSLWLLFYIFVAFQTFKNWSFRQADGRVDFDAWTLARLVEQLRSFKSFVFSEKSQRFNTYLSESIRPNSSSWKFLWVQSVNYGFL
jgi:hypothetical protein